MPLPSSSKLEFYFWEPRLHMTVWGRLTVRVLTYVSYLLLLAATFTFLLTGVAALSSFGILLLLFLGDRFLHLREADKLLNSLPAEGRVNLASYLTPAAYAVVERAHDRSTLKKTDFFLEATLQLLQAKEVRNSLQRLDIKPEEFRQKAEQFADTEHPKYSMDKVEDERHARVVALVQEALEQALGAGQSGIEPSDLFAALPEMNCAVMRRLFKTFSLETGDIQKAMIFGAASKQLSGWRHLPKNLSGVVLGQERGLRHRIMNRAWTARPTPVLDSVSLDLTDAARHQAVGFLIGHQAEYERLVETISRPVNPNAILIGEPGIGKTTIVEHLAADLVRDKVPPALFDKRLVELRLTNLVAGASPEELQGRIRRIADEILTAGNIILYVPEIHNLVKTSGTAYLSAADALMPIVANNALPVIGSTYPREYKQYIEARSDFSGAFESIQVGEISDDEAEKILTFDSLLLERGHRVTISFGAVKTSVLLAKKYFRNKFLPASAEELLKTALVAAEGKRDRFLGPDDVVRTAESRVNIPIHEATGEEAAHLLNLENVIHERLIDQEEAVKAVSDALREYRSGLSRQGGPIASFLFVGPTGVGKTELAKILTRIQFGEAGNMLRFDMTEYQDKQSFFRFIGSPDGNVSGALTDAVLKKPYVLILLDEFEKAHPDILNLFLQVLDDGRLTDNLGRTVDFTNTIVIATSNAHSDIINEALRAGETMSQIAEYLKRKLTDVFKPELINRFSKIIVFKDLAPEHVYKIAELNLQDLAERVSEQGIVLSFDPEAVKEVAKLGYEPAFGARPLRRVVEERIRAPLAQKILTRSIERGGSAKLIWNGTDFDFEKQDG